MSASLVVAGGTVVCGQGIVHQGGVAIDGERVSAVAADSALPDSPDVLDASGCYILPGVIDPHVHFRDPGLVDREDFATGSLAAAYGGVTTVFDMPNTVPPTASAQLVTAKRDIALQKSVVDFGLYGMVGQDNIANISEMAAAGVIGFKFYLHQGFGSLGPCDDGALLEAFERISETGVRAAVHAESPSIIGRRAAALRAEGRDDVAAFHQARPTISESETVEKCLSFAKSSGVSLHVCHVTSSATVQLLRNAKSSGLDVTAETGPQWLWFDQEDVARGDNFMIFSPPFRSEDDRAALWEGVRDGTIDMIATDHSPRHHSEKFTSSVWEAKSGFAGIETSVPLMLSAVNENRLSIEQYARVSSEGAARAFGLWPRKGGLFPGVDADVTVVRIGPKRALKSGNLHSRAPQSPFEGMSVVGEVVHTVLRGRLLVRNGEFVPGRFGRDVRLGTQ